MSIETSVDLPSFPMARDPRCPFDPPPGLRFDPPVRRVRIWDGSTPWLVTGYEHVRALLADPRVSADATRPGYPFSTVALSASVRRGNTFMSMDDPEHARYRRMLTSYFSVRRLATLRPRIRAMAEGLIETMTAGGDRADLVAALALPLPSMVICELLGVPYEERARFHRLAGVSISTTATAQQALAAADEMLGMIADLVTARATRPSEDILSHLVQQGELSAGEIAAVGRVLLLAGHETTANMISLGTAALLLHPEQLAQLRATTDPAVVASAVEELLRYLTITHHGRRRIALADIEIAGVTIRAGEGLVLTIESANRDPRAFPGDPDRIDIHRNPRHHLAFAFGPHQCLAQALARLELEIVFGTLFRRIPTLALAEPVEKLRFKHDMRIFGLHALPVRW